MKVNTGTIIKDIFHSRWNDEFMILAADDRHYTYGAFFENIIRAKIVLEELGIQKGDKLCLLIENSFELSVLYFSCLAMGVNAIPVDPAKGRQDITEILSQTKHKFVICNQKDFDYINSKIDVSAIRAALDRPIDASPDKLSIFDGIDYDALYLTTFTSGSTGVPKGVMHSFNNLVKSAVAFKQIFKFGPQNVFYHNLPMTYMAGILNLMIMPFIAGSKIVIAERFGVTHAIRFWEFPIRYSVNTFWFNPTILSLLVKLDRDARGPEYAARTKITACVGTAPLDYQVKLNFENKYKIAVHESYGLSETLFVSSNCPSAPQIRGCVGILLEGVELSFEPDTEIMIDTPWNFLGYSNIGTQEFLDGRKFRSGDFGEIDENRMLFIRGRKKDLIIKGGMNISPRRIEDFIGPFGFFHEFAVLGIKDTVLGEKIVCFFSPSENAYNDSRPKELNSAIIANLGKDYKIDEFTLLDPLPKNINGKIDKLKIKELYETR
jgi:long-chain acyl-CoA synthetase